MTLDKLPSTKMPIVDAATLAKIASGRGQQLVTVLLPLKYVNPDDASRPWCGWSAPSA